MSNSLIYIATPTTSSVASGSVLPLTTIVRRKGNCAIQQVNDSVVLNASGYYKVSVNATFTAPAIGVATLQLRQDNVLVNGATASTSIATATTEVDSLSFDAVVRVPCHGSPVILTIVNTGVAITTSNISIVVEYVG